MQVFELFSSSFFVFVVFFPTIFATIHIVCYFVFLPLSPTLVSYFATTHLFSLVYIYVYIHFLFRFVFTFPSESCKLASPCVFIIVKNNKKYFSCVNYCLAIISSRGFFRFPCTCVFYKHIG